MRVAESVVDSEDQRPASLLQLSNYTATEYSHEHDSRNHRRRPAQQAAAAQGPRRVERPRQDLAAAATRAPRPAAARTWKPGHEGGQTPIFRRLPKRGFSNDNFERRFHIVNLSDLERFDDGTTVDAAALIEAGLVPDDKQPVKILGDGELRRS